MYVCMYMNHSSRHTSRVGEPPVARRHVMPPHTSAGSARALAGVGTESPSAQTARLGHYMAVMAAGFFEIPLEEEENRAIFAG